MPLIRDEQEVKKTSQFIKYESGEGGNSLILKSHLYQINSHFLTSVSRSVECRETECQYCAANYARRSEYNYMVQLNGQNGFMDIKSTVFFAIQSIAKAQKRDPRQIAWTVIKKGERLNTEYTTSKDDNLPADDYDALLAELDDNTDKLVLVMEKHEHDLSENYTMYLTHITEQAKPKVKTAPVPTPSLPPVDENDEQDIDPEKIPF